MDEPVIFQKSPIIQKVEPGIYWWCACGRSRSQPFCDGSHVGTGLEPKKVEIKEAQTVAWCACKQSGTMPFCDGTHSRLPSDERKLATIMFTDMVGYSALAQRNETLALELLEDHRARIRSILSPYEGREIEVVGDAFLIIFQSPLQAVRCAIAIQRAFADPEIVPGRQVQLRIGLHLGDVIFRGNKVFGDGVNVGSRIEPLAAPGGICLTQQVYDHIQNKVELPLLKLGKRELKNISIPMTIYRVVLPWEKAERVK